MTTLYNQTHIRPIAFIMNTTSKLDIFVRDSVRITPNVDGQPTNRRQKDLDIRTCDKLRIHSIGHSKNGLIDLDDDEKEHDNDELNVNRKENASNCALPPHK